MGIISLKGSCNSGKKHSNQNPSSVQKAMTCEQSYKLNSVCATHSLAISQNDDDITISYHKMIVSDSFFETVQLNLKKGF